MKHASIRECLWANRIRTVSMRSFYFLSERCLVFLESDLSCYASLLVEICDKHFKEFQYFMFEAVCTKTFDKAHSFLYSKHNQF